ncbi:2,3-diaminopropionate biosynthesis protein SbnA [Fictibacillus nanhaiensis]|uniref:2,3-diaminopropionate biosynthesis protein SbnA n=1 Tax=Fictibacillus nanhaiensis TaxID=742169 RepID=UPI003C24B9C3
MLNRLKNLQLLIGNTPILKLQDDTINLFTKIESQNYMGSVKIRAAIYIIQEAIKENLINKNTTVIESSSGNMAISLALICRTLGINFIAVIDPNINSYYEKVLRTLAYKVEKVTERDSVGGYLSSRIKKVKELCINIPESFWTNQYENINNAKAHYYGLGKEISEYFDELHYAFIGVSSGGTISGVSKRLREKHKGIKIIAVDSEGSSIFRNDFKKRHIPGIGSSFTTSHVKNSIIDDVVIVSEVNSIIGCKLLLEEHGIFVGGSSGTCYIAIKEYFKNNMLSGNDKPNVIFISPDGGSPYIDTIYNEDWINETYMQSLINI